MKFPQAIRIQDVTDFFKLSFIGDPNQVITGINEIHMVEEGDITFVDHPKYYDKVLRSAATVIIINKTVECPEGKTLIFTDDPFSIYVGLVKRYRGFVPASMSVSESALIGEGTIIQPGAFIGNHVIIGKNCIIHANASIYDYSVIGDNVIIHSGSVIGADAFYYKRRPDFYDKLESCGRVVLANNVEVGACSTIDKGVSGDTYVGEGTKLDNHVQVGHDSYIGRNCLLGCASIIAGVTRLEDDVILWGRVAIQKDLVIGKGAVILATSAVDKTLEGGKTYWGAPAQEVRKAWRDMVYSRRLDEVFKKLGL